jgi:hypothetical protein
MLKSIVAGILAGLFALSLSRSAAGEVINVEFEFTPFVGDPAKEDKVTTVAGTARVFLNGALFAEQDVSAKEVPVVFDEREIAPSVWVPASSCGPALRKGKNTIRIEFDPSDAKAAYRAQLRWAEVMSESTEKSEDGRFSATNQSGEGVEEKEAKGNIVFERTFQADFAADLPWHHYPAVTALNDSDKKALGEMVARRVEAFKPDFAKLYALMEGREGIDLAGVKALKCIDKAYEVGARMEAPPPAEIEFMTSGGPEVVIRAKKGMLFFLSDMSVFEKITDEDVQMCAGMALSVVYPPRLVVVRSAAGAWEIAY